MEVQSALSRRTMLRAGAITTGALLIGSLETPLVEARGDGTLTWWVLTGGLSRGQAIELVAFMPRELQVNVGDTVKWVVEGKAPHTVTFPAGPFPGPSNPLPPPTPSGARYDGAGPLTSADLYPGSQYELTFTQPGRFPYLCLVHSTVNNQAMRAVINVRPAGSPRPPEAANPRRAAEEVRRRLFQKGVRIGVAALSEAIKQPNLVYVGVDDAREVVVNRFLPPIRLVKVGESVTFTVKSADPQLASVAPHTVAFGQRPPNFDDFGSPPIGDPNSFDGRYFLHSGLMWGTPPPGLPFPTRTTFRVRFVKPGTFHYICTVHTDVNQTGKIIVVPPR